MWPVFALVRSSTGRDRIGGLQPRGHLARLHGIDAWIVGAREEQHGRVVRVVAHVVVRRIGVERFELLRVLHGAILGDVERAVGGQLDAEHVVDCPRSIRRLRTIGCWVKVAPINRPPLEPPKIASFSCFV